MNTFQSLEKRYVSKVSSKCKNSLKVEDPMVQAWINKAIDGELTKEDYAELLKIGSWKSEQFPGLYYLCAIYIHPLTAAKGFCKTVFG